MKKRTAAVVLCVMMTLSMPLSLAGCGNPDKEAEQTAAEQMKTEQTKAGQTAAEETKADREEDGGSESNIRESARAGEEDPTTVNIEEGVADETAAITDFAVRLFQQSMQEKENTLISPISVLYALAMTANGAGGETLAQMEQVLGAGVGDLNDCLSTYVSELPVDEKYKLSIANSIWFTDDEKFTVEQDFLRINEDYYGAGVYETPFDNSTLQAVNEWVSENTDGMIEEILDNIPEESVMYLVNAIAFDAEWQTVYEEYQVKEGVFTMEDKTTVDAEYMYSTERQYLQDDKAQGFLKYYKDGKYAFAALLPNEGVTVAEYVESLTGEKLADILHNAEEVQVRAAIPKFESKYSVDLGNILQEMGMTDAFDNVTADFSGLGTYEDSNLAISRVLHKTFIAVDEKGTKAGAATAVQVSRDAAALVEEIKEVYLDRPFVYMLIDCKTNQPLFMGTLMSVEQ